MQVSILSIICMIVSAIVSIGLPIFLFIFFHKKYNARFLPMLVGITAFLLFALVLEQSVHIMVFRKFALREKPLVYVIYGILMAGVFEETARFIGFNLLKRRYTGIGTGLSYGVGHGGIEAVILAGLSMINSIIVSILINLGNTALITGSLQGDTLDRVNGQIQTLLTTAPVLFLFSGIERLFAISIQLALSILVFYAVYGKKKRWLYPLAIAAHAIIDIPAATMQVGLLTNIYVVEGLIGVSSLLILLFARYIHIRMKADLPGPIWSR